MTYEAFHAMLSWVYCDTEVAEPEPALLLLELSSKYKLTTLSSLCEDTVISGMAHDNVCQVLFLTSSLLSPLCFP